MTEQQQHDKQLRDDPPPSILLPSPPEHVLTAEQWGIFAAIADTVIPSFTPAKGNRLLQHPLRADLYAAAKENVQQIAGVTSSDDGLIDAFMSESATTQPEFRHALLRMLGYQMDATARKGFLFILGALK
jgi:hypothetical protein